MSLLLHVYLYIIEMILAGRMEFTLFSIFPVGSHRMLHRMMKRRIPSSFVRMTPKMNTVTKRTVRVSLLSADSPTHLMICPQLVGLLRCNK